MLKILSRQQWSIYVVLDLDTKYESWIHNVLKMNDATYIQIKWNKYDTMEEMSKHKMALTIAKTELKLIQFHITRKFHYFSDQNASKMIFDQAWNGIFKN